MRDDKLDNTGETNFNFIVNLHPTDGSHWVLAIRREDGPTHYFDSFGVETPPLLLKEYVDLGSNERIQQYDEYYCGAYSLYMIYLIDRRFRIKSALNILVNQVKCPEIYNECFCLGCHVKVNNTVNDKDNDNDNDIDNVNDNEKDNVNDNDNVNVKDNDNVNDNVNVKDNVKDNDNVNDNFTYLFGEKHQRGKLNNKECLSNNISININEDIQSWLNDDNIITEATFQGNS